MFTNDFFGNLAMAVHQTVAAVVGGDAIYQRGTERVPLAVAPGNSDHECFDSQTGSLTTWRSRDWLIVKSDLVLGGDVATPQRRDEIHIPAAGGRTEIYVVHHPDANTAPWRYADPTDRVYRVHSFLDRTEPTPT